jgi:cytochrome c556
LNGKASDVRIYLSLAALILIAMIRGASATQQTPRPADPYRPTATIKEIMDTMIDPSADFLWEAVSVTIDAGAITRHQPRTEADWAQLKQRAVTLMEASNLLLIPGRRVAKPGDKSENPGIELGPDEIEALIAKNPASWTNFSHGLHDAAKQMLEAIEARNVEKVSDLGGVLDHACENCHLKFWYPVEAGPPSTLRPER